MLPLLPFGISLIAAIVSEWINERREQRVQKSIEVCTASCRAAWLKEDGVLRVYASTSSLSCAQIVVEVDGEPPMYVPKNIEEHPVSIRMIPEGTIYGATEEEAAEKFLAMAQAHNRGAITEEGQAVRKKSSNQSEIILTGPRLTEREERYLNYIGEKFSVDTEVQTGPTTVRIIFTKSQR